MEKVNSSKLNRQAPNQVSIINFTYKSLVGTIFEN